MTDILKDELPRQFGAYLLFDKIGEGGMARIYLGHQKMDLGGERLVVVKQVLPVLADNDEFCRLLTQEAKLASNLSHGNIAQVIELGRHEQTLYIAMEYVEGFDLRELLKRCAKKKLPLPVEFSLFVVIEALRGLDYAHKMQDDHGAPLGIVHRDVSPSNVLVSFDGDVKLCDFGIALAMGMEESPSQEDIKGKAGYMSPEAAAGEVVDSRSDIFAMGIILWELLAGRRLYRGKDKKPPTLEHAMQAEIPELPDRGFPSQDELYAIVKKALTKDVSQRFQAASEMLSALEGYVRNTQLFASPLKFGHWLTDNFDQDILERRRARERAARALARGPLVEVVARAGSQVALDKTASRAPAAQPRSGAPLWLAVLALCLILVLVRFLAF